MSTPPRILLVEDSEADAHLARSAFALADIACEIDVVRDGEEALAYLTRDSLHGDAPRPALVLMDLRLPGCTGLEALVEIKASEELRAIPVVMLSTSGDPHDAAACYGARANAYIAKPHDLDGLVAMARSIHTLWLSAAGDI